MFNMDGGLTSFLLGNYALVFAGLIVLVNHFMGNNTNDISKDIQILTFMSTIFRWFWSTDLSSDAPIWEEGHWCFKWLCYIELLISTGVWGAVVLLVKAPERENRVLPWWTRWYSCLVWSLSGPALLCLNPDFWNPRVRFTLEAYTVPWNMALDTFGMLPQLYLLYSADTDKLPASWVSHFVGLMCIDRVARVVFWIGYFWHGPYLLSFIIPDLVHTLLMADYIYLWVKLVKKASAAQLGVDELMALEGSVDKDDEKKKDDYVYWLKYHIASLPSHIDFLLTQPSIAVSRLWDVMNHGEKVAKQKLEKTEMESLTKARNSDIGPMDNQYNFEASPAPNASAYSAKMENYGMNNAIGNPFESPTGNPQDFSATGGSGQDYNRANYNQEKVM
jgi:hypothetical protein